MLTIEQAAVEYAESLEDNDYTIETEFAFKAGVRFAQRFIPIEEELPEIEGKYIVIRNGNTEFEQWKITNNKGYWYDYLGITHWRHINIK